MMTFKSWRLYWILLSENSDAYLKREEQPKEDVTKTVGGIYKLVTSCQRAKSLCISYSSVNVVYLTKTSLSLQVMIKRTSRATRLRNIFSPKALSLAGMISATQTLFLIQNNLSACILYHFLIVNYLFVYILYVYK